MPNRRLTKEETDSLFKPLISNVRGEMAKLCGDDAGLLWALRRKLAKELIYDERGTPAHRNKIKRLKRTEQNNLCAVCKNELEDKNTVLDRFKAMLGYTVDNTRVLCKGCDTNIQQERRYRDV